MRDRLRFTRLTLAPAALPERSGHETWEIGKRSRYKIRSWIINKRLIVASRQAARKGIGEKSVLISACGVLVLFFARFANYTCAASVRVKSAIIKCSHNCLTDAKLFIGVVRTHAIIDCYSLLNRCVNGNRQNFQFILFSIVLTSHRRRKKLYR